MRIWHGPHGLTFVRGEDGAVTVQFRVYEERGTYHVFAEETMSADDWALVIAVLLEAR